MQKVFKWLACEWRYWDLFWSEQIMFWSAILTKLLGWSTFIKKISTSLMYRQQGRFSGWFLHGGMAMFTILVITSSSSVENLILNKGGQRRTYDPQFVLATEANYLADTQVSEGNKGETVEYRVAENDTVASIAKTFGVSIDTILWENNLKSVDSIKPKQIIRILPTSGVRHTVNRGETIYSIAKDFQVDAQSIVDYPFNTFANDETFSLNPGQDLFVPDGIKPNSIMIDRPRNIATEVPPVPGVKGEGNFIWASYGIVTQRYGWFHTGVDLANRSNPPIWAAQGGSVVKAGWNAGGYGNYVVIDHGNGYKTLYGHMLNNSLLVKAGDVVKQHQQIGTMGSTGRSTGTHLHFEVFKDNKRMDPMAVLPKL